MAIEWTAEQREAIEARGCNTLVAAAAGSGKTAVLVERIIRLICDAENPVPADRLLVLTFTEAAAAEMKRKIGEAMEERLRRDPDNGWLREQTMLIPSAQISTVHAFCKTVLQNAVCETELPADFTLIDDTANAVLRNQALDQVLEEYYRRIDRKTAFRELAVGYGGTKSDDTLRETVLKLHHFVRSLAYPEQWLHQAAEEYKEVARRQRIEGTIWERLLLSLGRELAAEIREGLDLLWQMVEKEVPSDHKYFEYYQQLPALFESSFAPLLAGEATLTELESLAASFSLPRAPVKKGLDEGWVERLNQAKKQLVTEPLQELHQLAGGASAEQIERIILCSPRVETLKQLVRQTERLHRRMKRERSVLDFGDLEHEMIRLLSDRKGNPTETALKLRERYAEILVDEYQDTNNIQDTIFRIISGEKGNLFMVGDLKQSIYRFRNADPYIFAEKYHRYRQGEGGRCICLFKNFRSRSQVVDAVNGVFSAIMKKKTGGLDYTKEEYLVQGASYPQGEGDYTTELLLSDCRREEGEEGDVLSAAEREAESIACRIGRLMQESFRVTDSKTQERRPLRLGDITILVRNKGRVAELEQALARHGIPSISEVGEKYLDTREVLTVLSFLQIIDNPRQDIPLLAVLRSALFGFTPEELGELRLPRKKGDFYDALLAAANAGNERVCRFLDVLESLRKESVHCGVDTLIWRICHDLHYLDLVGAMSGGAVRQANLNLLYERGAEFEQGSLHGLFRFMEYIDNLRSENRDMVAAKGVLEQEEMVSVMTIHKSKGLEFPVVILAGMDGEFNERDASATVLWHERDGLAMDYIDTRLRVRYPSPAHALVRESMLRDSRAEEMRLFYVAMTRAKEKLILSAVIGNHHDGWRKVTPLPDGTVPTGMIRRQRSMRDWTLSALLSHPALEEVRVWSDREDILPQSEVFALKVLWGEEGVVGKEKTPKEKTEVSQKGESISLERLSYRYPHEGLRHIPFKMSVSELKRRQVPEEDVIPMAFPIRQQVLTEKTPVGAMERGTITHYVMQHLDFSRTEEVEEVEKQLEEMVERGRITRRQKAAVSAADLAEFFQKPLGIRLKAAKHVEREFAFYMKMPASALQEGLSAEDGAEEVLLQGIADCFFYDGDGIVLLDYKTDAIEKEQAMERAARYTLQMECYAKGLADVLECPVVEQYLCFLHCGETVAVGAL